MYKIIDRLTTPVLIISRTGDDSSGKLIYKENGVTEQIWCVWKNYGGTAKQDKSGLVWYQNTAEVECYYTPLLKQNDLVKNLLTDELFEVISVPDNINQLNKFLKFKVKRAG